MSGQDKGAMDVSLEQASGRPVIGFALKLRRYSAIARPDHWIKNVFMLFGTGAAFIINPEYLRWSVARSILLGLAATCLIASSNYVLNEILDAPSDREHPEKRHRSLASGLISTRVALVQWIAIGTIGLLLAWRVNVPFFLSGLGLWAMGVIYNVPPIRSKELPIIDVLSEAVNNPIRFLLGWYAVSALKFPPSSMLIAYWMLGAFFMAGKRLAEYRELDNPGMAARYRKSFAWYTEHRLVISMIMYGSGFMFFFAVVVTKYHPELILSAPFLMGLMGYVTKLSFDPDSIVQNPEKLFKRPWFLAYALCCVALMLMLSLVSIPSIRTLLGLTGRSW
jgi:decaprenyl-phosphate phosphoribosyltransferase